MGRALDDFMAGLRGELSTGGGATLDELYNLAEALQTDLEELEASKGLVFEIDPNKNYLICFDSRSTSIDDVHRLMARLPFNNASAAVITNGDPNEVIKIVESQKE